MILRRLVLALISGAIAGCAESGPGFLQGQALDARDQKPYVDAEIRAVGPSGEKKVNTDVRGNYQFESLPSGTYQVTASMGRKSQVGRIKVLAGQRVRLNFRF
ncbi:MAG: carboxypeptidase-like regulatory domain-containing protein [Bacteroidota bacterium]